MSSNEATLENNIPLQHSSSSSALLTSNCVESDRDCGEDVNSSKIVENDVDECDTVVVETVTDNNVAFEIEMVTSDVIGNEELVITEEQVIDNEAESVGNMCADSGNGAKQVINECSNENIAKNVDSTENGFNECESEKSQSICKENVKIENSNSQTKQMSQDFDCDNTSTCSERSCSLKEPTPNVSVTSVSGNINQTTSNFHVEENRTATNCSTAQTPSASAVGNNLSPSLVSDSMVNSSTSIGIHKKKFGKFRILLDNEQNQTSTNSSVFMQTQHESSNDTGVVSEDSCSVDSKSEKCAVEPFVPPTLLRQQSQASGKEVVVSSPIDEQNGEVAKKTSKVGRKKNSTKKRGKGVLKKGKSIEETLFDLAEEAAAANRRRSSRIKSLEEKKEQERAEKAKTNAEPSQQVKSDGEDKEVSVTSKEKLEKEKKTKNKKHKEDKDKRKKKNRRKKSNSHIFDDDSSEDGNKQKSNENSENNKTSNSDCFTAPLPPSQLNALKNSNSNINLNAKNTTSDSDESPKPEKVKSRWRRSSELESGHSTETSSFINSSGGKSLESLNNSFSSNAQNSAPIQVPKETEPVPPFEMIEESVYLFERRKSKSKKEVRRMVCDCILTKEERQRGIFGCGDDCLNRMLMIECGSRCPLGDHCANKRFQKKQFAKVDPFRTEKKGWGLRTLQPIQAGQFIMEYVGEVLAPKEFKSRVAKYSKENRVHHYFMALKNDEIIDATEKGNLTRFVNHSCDPNAETQKWTVNGELRIGFFAKRNLEIGDEITFDYQFQRYGEKAQRCYCESSNCRGYIGATQMPTIGVDGIRLKQKVERDEEVEEKSEEEFEDLALEEEIEKLTASGGLRNRQQTLLLARLMVRAEDSVNRQKLLEVMKSTQEVAYLRLLLDYHGLQLLWSWMFELEDVWLKAEILEVLEILPIPNKTMLKDSKVLDVVEKWSKLNIEQQATTAQTRSSIEVVEQAAADVLSTAKLDEIGQKAAEEQKPSEIVVKAEGPQVLVKRENDEANTTEMADVCKDSKEKVEEEPSVCEGENAKQPMETDNRPTVVEVSCKNEANDTMKESDSTVNVSKATTMNSEKVSPIVQETKSEGPKPVPNIAMLAARLLNSWKDLKEVFRIPRLERQKRHEDEKEADRKTKELEERRARGLPIIYDKSKRGIDDRDCTIAGILGLRKKAVKRQADDKKVSQSNVNMTSPHTNLINNDMSAPTPPKVNKDAHRLQFEMELMRKQYEEAMKAYKNQMMQYHAMVQQQIMQPQGPPQAPSLHYPNSFEPLPMQPPPQLPHQMPPPPPQHPQPPFYPCDSSFQRFPQPNSVHCNNDYIGTPNSNSYEEYSDRINSSLEICHELSHKPTILLSNSSVLIECTSDEHFLMNDEKAVISTDYGVEYVPVKDKSEAKSKTLFDPIYPAPGVYYKFESKTYFVPQPFDHKGHRVEPVVFEGITLPLPASTTKKVISTAFPRNWRASNDKEGNVYYYNKATKRTQWNLPEQEMECVSNGNCVKTQSESVVISSADSTSTPKDEIEQQREVTPIEMNGETSLSTPDAVSNIDCSGTPLNSLPGSQTFEPDPRKRKQLNNPVAHLLSGTSNITNSDNSLLSSVTANRHYPAITESRTERKMKEKFKAEMSEHIKYCLNPYRKMDCKIGRIVNNEDFKYLARKLTHFVMVKELKHCKSIEELSCNETVKHKAKDYVRKYMAKQGPIYKTEGMEEKDERSPKDGISLDTVLEQSIDAI